MVQWRKEYVNRVNETQRAAVGNPKVILIESESQECSTVTYREHLEARTPRKIPTTPDCQCLRVENEISQIVGKLIENSTERMYSIKIQEHLPYTHDSLEVVF